MYMTLIELGFEYLKDKKITNNTSVINEYYIKDNICVRVLEIDSFKVVISIYVKWDSSSKCGKCLYYDIKELDMFNCIHDMAIINIICNKDL